jgi:hypothetical protein
MEFEVNVRDINGKYVGKLLCEGKFECRVYECGTLSVPELVDSFAFPVQHVKQIIEGNFIEKGRCLAHKDRLELL